MNLCTANIVRNAQIKLRVLSCSWLHVVMNRESRVPNTRKRDQNKLGEIMVVHEQIIPK